MKTASDFLSEANSAVEKMDTETAIGRHGQENVVFIDVRDGKEIDTTGTIQGAQRIPRGFINLRQMIQPISIIKRLPKTKKSCSFAAQANGSSNG